MAADYHDPYDLQNTLEMLLSKSDKLRAQSNKLEMEIERVAKRIMENAFRNVARRVEPLANGSLSARKG